MKPREKRSSATRARGGGRAPMGFFARRLTAISIVYDFNNLGAAPLARLDTFSVVNRATKSVFMGKSRQSGTDCLPVCLPVLLSFACRSPPALFLLLFALRLSRRSSLYQVIVRRPSSGRRTRCETADDRKDPSEEEEEARADPLVPLTTDRSRFVARKTLPG